MSASAFCCLRCISSSALTPTLCGNEPHRSTRHATRRIRVIPSTQQRSHSAPARQGSASHTEAKCIALALRQNGPTCSLLPNEDTAINEGGHNTAHNTPHNQPASPAPSNEVTAGYPAAALKGRASQIDEPERNAAHSAVPHNTSASRNEGPMVKVNDRNGTSFRRRRRRHVALAVDLKRAAKSSQVYLMIFIYTVIAVSKAVEVRFGVFEN